jgi:small-conductance mechanosensitive channel
MARPNPNRPSTGAAPRTSRQVRARQQSGRLARGRVRTRRRTRRPRGAAGAEQGARTRLRAFRQASILAVALTALLLMIFAPEEVGGTQEAPPAAAPAADTLREIPDTVAIIEPVGVDELQRELETEAAEEERPDVAARRATGEAAAALRDVWIGFIVNLPKVLVALGVLALAWLVVRVLRPPLRRAFGYWERGNAIAALIGFGIWLVAIGTAISVLAGDIRALVGSIGLVGLALSWALQTPIESFTGWLMNSFHGYYRVGDRVAVGEIFGDVYRIDFLTTTVWEIGSPERGGFVTAEQPTGRLITFPNNEVLAGSIVNLTRDFPYVWDELTIAVANKSDLNYSMEVLRQVANEVIGDQMIEPARQYRAVLQLAGLDYEVAEEPEVFVSLDDSWTNMTVRYLVAARERRRWKSRLSKAAMEAYTADEHAEKILSVFPRRQIQIIGPDGKPREPMGGEG